MPEQAGANTCSCSTVCAVKPKPKNIYKKKTELIPMHDYSNKNNYEILTTTRKPLSQ